MLGLLRLMGILQLLGLHLMPRLLRQMLGLLHLKLWLLLLMVESLLLRLPPGAA